MPSPDRTVHLVMAESTATTYTEWLSDEWNLSVSHGHDAALSDVTETVGVVVVDDDGLETTAETVLDSLRDRGIDRPVVTVLDEGPAADTVGMRCNEYLVRPVDEPDLRATVAELVGHSSERVQKAEYLALAASQAALELQLSPSERDESEEYERLRTRLGDLRERARAPIDELEEEVATRLT